jgi:hypothetical protein
MFSDFKTTLLIENVHQSYPKVTAVHSLCPKAEFIKSGHPTWQDKKVEVIPSALYE